ncbi:MAG: ABC transporter permease [Balneolaceae bacterium]|nr:MAG: ABC transporter permease [Balneolaceae bacterium]
MNGINLKIALRDAKKKPVYTAINLTGLIVGVACSVLIALFVWDELKFDRHHEHADQIYRVVQYTETSDNIEHGAITPFPLKDALLNDFPAFIKDGVRFFNLSSEHVSIGNPETNEKIRHNSFYFADPSLFKIFDVELLRGNPELALSEPNSVIITGRIARLYFGDEDPVGKTLTLEGRIILTVTGVMEDWDRNSHFKPEILASFESLRGMWQNYDQITERWRWNPVWTYVLLEPGADSRRIEGQLQEFADRYYSDYFSEEERIGLELQPLTDIWLHSDLEAEIGPTSSVFTVYLFSAVAVLLLIIACINFINLSTARAILRAREVGVRKTLGAERSTLMKQFMMESTIFTGTAVLLGGVVTVMVYPYVSRFSGRELLLSGFGSAEIILGILMLILVLSLLSGLYPSLFLSSLKPIESLRGGFSSGSSRNLFRKSLIVFQFSITALLFIGTALVYFQYIHMQEKDLGFNHERVIVIPAAMTSAIWSYDDLKERSLSHSGVLQVTGSKTVIGGEDYLRYQITPEGFGEQESASFIKLFVMHDFTETLGIELLAGRNFSKSFSTDPEEALLINESMVNHLDWGSPEDAIGKTFRVNGRTMSVVGVTRDFNHTYLRRELEPLVMELPAGISELVSNIEFLKVRLAAGNPSDAISHIESVWRDVDTTHPFDYFYLEDKINETYASERQLTSVLSFFAILTIFIGCLGLLGLASYSVNTRTREIAIRKTLGSSEMGIFVLLSKDYLKLVGIAHLVALPAAWVLASRWLSSFPYHIELNTYLLATFILSLIVSTLIALLTISSQSLKAAYKNPVDGLRIE